MPLFSLLQLFTAKNSLLRDSLLKQTDLILLLLKLASVPALPMMFYLWTNPPIESATLVGLTLFAHGVPAMLVGGYIGSLLLMIFEGWLDKYLPKWGSLLITSILMVVLFLGSIQIDNYLPLALLLGWLAYQASLVALWLGRLLITPWRPLTAYRY